MAGGDVTRVVRDHRHGDRQKLADPVVVDRVIDVAPLLAVGDQSAVAETGEMARNPSLETVDSLNQLTHRHLPVSEEQREEPHADRIGHPAKELGGDLHAATGIEVESGAGHGNSLRFPRKSRY